MTCRIGTKMCVYVYEDYSRTKEWTPVGITKPAANKKRGTKSDKAEKAICSRS